MHVVYGHHDLFEYLDCQFFIQEREMFSVAYCFGAVFLNELEQVFALAELHHKMNMAFCINDLE